MIDREGQVSTSMRFYSWEQVAQFEDGMGLLGYEMTILNPESDCDFGFREVVPH